jgi:hypothetical protein
MRKTVAVVLAVVGTLWLVAPPAHAQAPAAAPAPKVTITGLVDNVTSWNHNMSMVDNNMARNGETEWIGRTRVRPDITAEVGTTKFVLGLEIDAVWGQTGNADTPVLTSTAVSTNGPNRFGSTGSWDLNTDTIGMIEIKWAYTQFELPWVPWKTTVRLGAQPFADLYKVAAYAQGDYAGVHLETVINPALKFNFTFAQLEEESTGPRDGFIRGEDFAIIAGLQVTPFKGLDILPLYSYFSADSVTAGNARQGRGGVANSTAFFPLGAHEGRHTIGVDARWRSGPFSLDPTILYQFGKRDVVDTTGLGPVATIEQGMSAWLIDLRGGFQLGPLLLEAAAIYTSGNSAREDVRNPRRTVEFFQPLDTDTSYYTGWAEIWALGIDYLQIMRATAAGLNPGVAIGYDKYGLMRLGFRPSYAVTPAFTVRGAVTANWTAEKVDTASVLSTANGLTPGDGHGNASYLGTEIDLGFQWRFAPNVAFDMVGGWNFAGNALAAQCNSASTSCTATSVNARNPQDTQTVVARVRYTW